MVSLVLPVENITFFVDYTCGMWDESLSKWNYSSLVGCVSASVTHPRIMDNLLDLGRLINKSKLHHSMTSYRRSRIGGGTYFFTQVTHQRQPWLCTDVARSLLRAAFLKVRQKYPFAIDAIVLLPDHIHCIWTLPPDDSDYATRWRLIKSDVTKQGASALHLQANQSESRQKRRESNLWQRRFWEHSIRDDDDFVRHCDYIHYNPVKHGLCRRSIDWEYSSFHRYVAQGVYSVDWGMEQGLMLLSDEDFGDALR